MMATEREIGMILESLDTLKDGQKALFAIVNEIRSAGCAKAPEHTTLSDRISRVDSRLTTLEMDKQRVVGMAVVLMVVSSAVTGLLIWLGKIVLKVVEARQS
jgi:hypothetical protein